MVLMRVDLPEPDGPQTTTTSPLRISVEHSLSTCTEPYHLLTFLSWIMGVSLTEFLLACHRAVSG